MARIRWTRLLLRTCWAVYIIELLVVRARRLHFESTRWLLEDSITRYGINTVSGYYGPGSVIAWMLTAVGCCISQLSRERLHINKSRSWMPGFNLNLAVALGYPIVAAGDLLLRLRGDFGSDGSSIRLGSVLAPLVVVQEGCMFCGVLFAISAVTYSQKRLGVAPLLFAAFSVIAMLIVLFIADKHAGIKGPRHLMAPKAPLLADLLPVELRNREARRGSELSILLSESGLLGKESPIEGPFLLFSLAYKIGTWRVVLSSLIVMWSYASGLISLNQDIIPEQLNRRERLISAIFMVVLGPIVFLFCFMLVESIGFWVVDFLFLYCRLLSIHVPLSTVSLTDLDQMTALMFGGVFVLSTDILEALRERDKIE